MYVEKPNQIGALWGWNGDPENPQFTPSLNIVGQCHCFVRRGRAQGGEDPNKSYVDFCSDSKHDLAGKVVEMPDWPSDLGDAWSHANASL